ncbi:Uncharacterized protein HZ326_24678 [Fusarium oxysporum f. sp. albedinis]|nr:Uncharacterized protein HZ326_24678 [Fusarium oxysporum f. sp. albedinis]
MDNDIVSMQVYICIARQGQHPITGCAAVLLVPLLSESLANLKTTLCRAVLRCQSWFLHSLKPSRWCHPGREAYPVGIRTCLDMAC